MTGRLRRLVAVGLSVLIGMGTLSPAALADSLSTSPPSTNPPGSTTSPRAEPSGSTSYSLKPDDFSLTLSPTRLVIAGADIKVTQKIQAINRGQLSVEVSVQKRNFTAGSDGSLLYQADAPYAAAEWVTIDPATFDLQPGATQVVTASVKVPENAEPGDHQVALIFMVPPDKTDANITINRGIGTPVYVTVPGEVVESVSLSDLSAPGFATGGPVPITATVHNAGNVHEDYRGNSPLVVDAPGSPAAFPDFTVPRDSVRDISTTWDPPFIGIFNPTVTLTESDGTTHSQSVQVIVFPVREALILLGALLVLFLGIWFVRRRYRSSVQKAAVAMNGPPST